MKIPLPSIKGVIILPLKILSDERGTLVETYRRDMLPEGIDLAMSYVSYTEPGYARGPHEHLEQTDVFSFIGPGDFEIYLCDNRMDSPTFGKKMRFVAGESNPVTVVVPPRIVHGYRNISENIKSMVLNYPDRLFMGRGKKGPVDEIRHEDIDDEFNKDFQGS